MSGNQLTKDYFELIERVIDEEGIYPHQALVTTEDGGLQMHALAVDVPTLIRHFWNTIGTSKEVVYGLDMSTRPDQGTRYADALVLAHWTKLPGKPLSDPECLKVGVINYQDEPRIVDPIDWENSHWDQWVRATFNSPTYKPPFLVRVESGQ